MVSEVFVVWSCLFVKVRSLLKRFFHITGYVTTNTRYIALVEDVIAPENVQLQKSRENDLKTLIVSKRLYRLPSLLQIIADQQLMTLCASSNRQMCMDCILRV